jgi:hypothetical protein
LRKLSWGGVPEGLRVVVWMLLLVRPFHFSSLPWKLTVLVNKRATYLLHSRGDKRLWHENDKNTPTPSNWRSREVSKDSMDLSGIKSVSMYRELDLVSDCGWSRELKGSVRDSFTLAVFKS